MDGLAHSFRIWPTDSEYHFQVLIFDTVDSLNHYAGFPEPIDAGFIPLDPRTPLDSTTDAAIRGLEHKMSDMDEALRRICDVAGVLTFGVRTTALREPGCAGQFLFYAGGLKPGRIAHEALHAMLWRNVLKSGSRDLKFGKGKIANKAEENFAQLQGEIIDAVWDGSVKVRMAMAA